MRRKDELDERTRGFFELEFARRSHFHHGALALNSARSCLGYIIRARRPNKIYVPAYSCETLLEPLFSRNIEVVFYHIDDRMELIDLGCKLTNFNLHKLFWH